MWKCNHCGEEITKDKYKNCWNCGKPKPTADEVETVVKLIPPKFEQTIKLNPPIEIKPAAEVEKSPISEISPQPEPSTISVREEEFQPPDNSESEEKSPSIIGKIIPVLLWLAAVGGIGYFAYLSVQKTTAFEQKIAADFQNFNSQKGQFIFPSVPTMRKGTLTESNIIPKVLPLKVKTGEVDSLFSFLPDDLRPSDISEVKTLMWLNCENNAVGKKQDGAVSYQEKCAVYLVEKDTNKLIGVQDFLGVMPALAKERDGENAVGKVFPEKYVAFLREKQPESERVALQDSTESPNHHFYTKSEFIISLLLLGLLAAIGFGWLAYNLRFKRD